jgi:myo-inositol-1(or 4)-monophosphatase
MIYRNFRSVKKVNFSEQHDIKLELDVLCQKTIFKTLLSRHPDIALLGEEGVSGKADADYRWVVDPIDGTVNFAYEIPHACVSIALQEKFPTAENPLNYRGIMGVVYDPFCDELWTATRGGPARLNNRIIRVSNRSKLAETIIGMGFAKINPGLERITPAIMNLAPRVRKVRLMGSAALDMVYVASGRLDAYIETGVKLWDIAAGAVILESAGGEFWHQITPQGTYAVLANNGLIRKKLEKYL